MKLRDTLSATLLAHADAPRRWTSPLSPAPAKAYPLWLLALRTLLRASVVTGLCWLWLRDAYDQWVILWWPFWMVVSIGVVWGGMTVLAWNRRAARLRNAAAAGQPAPVQERLPIWACFTLVPLYYLLFFVLTPLVLALSVANTIYQAKWSSYRQELVARGVELDITRLAAKTVPDAENFANTPLFKDLGFSSAALHSGVEKAAKKRLNNLTILNARQANPPLWNAQKRIRLADFRTVLTNASIFPQSPTDATDAAAVLAALKGWDKELSEIESAAAMPFMVFPVRYQDTFSALLPHVGPIKNFSAIYSLRASARLASSDARGGLQDVKTGYRLGNFSAFEPLLISYLVGIAMDAQTLQPIWEGLQAKTWNESQLAELDSLLAARDYAALSRRAVDGERAFGTTMMEMWIGDREELAKSVYIMDSLEMAGFMKTVTVTRGRFFMAENLISINRWYDQLLPRDGSWPDFRTAQETMSALIARPKHPSEALVRMLFPAIGNFFEKSTTARTHQSLARTAIALERHQLATGSYPDTLAALSPQFLASPLNDPFGKEPFHYSKTSDSRYLLYSVGSNGHDDRGRAVKRKQRDDFRLPKDSNSPTTEPAVADDIAWTYLPLEK